MVVVVLGMLLLPPIPQRQAYHDLVDRRVVLGVPHFGDVMTHVLCPTVGLLGLTWVLSRRGGRRPGAFRKPAERRNYVVFFLGFTLTAFGSTWYHLNPGDGGDLRPYFCLVQAYPMLAVALMMVLFQPRYSRWACFWLMFATYALAVVFEALDRPIYDLAGVISGHSLKHICVATATFWIVLMLRWRHLLAGISTTAH